MFVVLHEDFSHPLPNYHDGCRTLPAAGMTRSRMRTALLLLFAFTQALPAAAQAPSTRLREIAVTFDDLPLVTGRPTSIEEQERIMTSLVGVLSRRRIAAIGFVNEDKLQENGRPDPRRVGLLRQWTRAGLELGNHTYSHLDLHRVSAEQFRDDILRGEAVTRNLLGETGKKPRFFRHPFLHTGRDTITRRDIASFLDDHGYRVAPVTIDNYDYVFARAYDKAIAARDTSLQRRVRDEYLGYMDRILMYYEKQSIALLGRNIPHVLLLHANTLNARSFDMLAGAYEKRGYRFVALDYALQDPAYAMADMYVGDAGITWLHRWAMTQGRRGAVFAGEPEVPKWIERAAAP
jgi:peptidoglycan/xylan/chitin deacetylase (PgdA/CDA1 family)